MLVSRVSLSSPSPFPLLPSQNITSIAAGPHRFPSFSTSPSPARSFEPIAGALPAVGRPESAASSACALFRSDSRQSSIHSASWALQRSSSLSPGALALERAERGPHPA